MADSERGDMLIGQLARAAGVGVETIRFYEREDILTEPRRNASGYRIYDEGALRRVRFVLRAKALGFSLSETKELLALRVLPDAPWDDVRITARAKLADVDRRLRELRRIRSVLAGLIDACESEQRTGDCPILDALDDPAGDAPHKAAAPFREVDLVYFEGCPHVELTRSRLKAVLGSKGKSTWREWDLRSDATPKQFLRFPSPTVLVDGVDVDGGDSDASALACRARAPSVRNLRRMLDA